MLGDTSPSIHRLHGAAVVLWEVYMDCKTARHVWNHNGGLIDGLNCKMPGLVDHLIALTRDFVDQKPDPFDAAVKCKAGDGPYRVVHSDGTSQMAIWIHDVLGDEVAKVQLQMHIGAMLGIPNLRFALICCSGCKVSKGYLGFDKNLKIQLAAVNTKPDGSDFEG